MFYYETVIIHFWRILRVQPCAARQPVGAKKFGGGRGLMPKIKNESHPTKKTKPASNSSLEPQKS